MAFKKNTPGCNSSPDCNACKRCYALVDCAAEDGTSNLFTRTNLKDYVGHTVSLVGYVGRTFTVLKLCHCSSSTVDVEVDEDLSDESCIHYELTDCDDPETVLCTNFYFGDNVGKTIRIASGVYAGRIFSVAKSAGSCADPVDFTCSYETVGDGCTLTCCDHEFPVRLFVDLGAGGWTQNDVHDDGPYGDGKTDQGSNSEFGTPGCTDCVNGWITEDQCAACEDVAGEYESIGVDCEWVHCSAMDCIIGGCCGPHYDSPACPDDAEGVADCHGGVTTSPVLRISSKLIPADGGGCKWQTTVTASIDPCLIYCYCSSGSSGVFVTCGHHVQILIASSATYESDAAIDPDASSWTLTKTYDSAESLIVHDGTSTFVTGNNGFLIGVQGLCSGGLPDTITIRRTSEGSVKLTEVPCLASTGTLLSFHYQTCDSESEIFTPYAPPGIVGDVIAFDDGICRTYLGHAFRAPDPPDMTDWPDFGYPVPEAKVTDCDSCIAVCLFQQCCTALAADPVTGFLSPTNVFWADCRGGTGDLVVGKIYDLTLVDGHHVCASYIGPGKYELGSEISDIADFSYDTCTDCLITCAACCDQYLDSITITLPTITASDDSCSNVAAGWNARMAGRHFTFGFSRGSCSDTIFKELPFTYTAGACGGTGDDGNGTATVEASIVDNGDGTFSLYVFLEVFGSGTAIAEVEYKTTLTCFNCRTGSYNLSFSPGFPAFGNASEPLVVQFTGVDCSEMARPGSEEEALALSPGTRFVAPDGSVRIA